MSGTSFSGNGFVLQNVTNDQFKMAGDFILEIVFTTLKANGTLLKITNYQNVREYKYLYSIRQPEDVWSN